MLGCRVNCGSLSKGPIRRILQGPRKNAAPAAIGRDRGCRPSASISVGANIHRAETEAVGREHALRHIASIVDVADADADAAEVVMMEAPMRAAEGLCGSSTRRQCRGSE